VNNRQKPALPTRLAVLAALMLAWVTLPHQASAQGSSSSADPVVITSEPGAATLPAFRSALEGYQRHSDEKMLDWKQTNDNVGQIGGWRAYARQASGSDAPESTTADKPAPKGAASTQAAPHHPESRKP
jgi:hypothetical protein